MGESLGQRALKGSSSLESYNHKLLSFHWLGDTKDSIGQKVLVTCYGKCRTNFLAKPIFHKVYKAGMAKIWLVWAILKITGYVQI